MPDVKLDQPILKIDGSNIATDIMKNLVEIEADTSLGMPDMFILRFHDETFTIMDGETFALGKEIEVSFADAETPTTPLVVMKGEITAIEPEFSDNTTTILTIRGYDKTHRLSRGTVIKGYTNVKDSDVVSQIASSAGLTTEIEATTEVFPHIFQDNISNMAFLEQLAKRNGYALVLHDSKIVFKSPASLASAPILTLEWGKDLSTFRPRVALAQQVSGVTVKGWDPKTKQAITGEATSSSSQPAIGLGKSGIQASQPLGNAIHYEVRQILNSQSHAQKLATAILNQQNSEFIEAEGMTFGNAKLIAGKMIKIAKVGTKFSGNYIITSATHRYNALNGYITQFRVEGAQTFITADYLQDKPQSNHNRWYGVYPAIVTNIKDTRDNQQGVLKVKYPWLDDLQESHWARLVTPSAGASRGMIWMPEVNDEVLVVFEQGDFNRPYVIGSMWNGRDNPPFTSADIVGTDGKVNLKGIKTRTGHMLKFIDEAGKEKIEIIDKSGNLKLTFDSTGNNITIEAGAGNIELKGKDVSITATGNFTATATGNFEVKGNGTGKVESSAPLTIKGAMVNIN